MTRNYKFLNSEGSYFVSFAVVNWIDVFTCNEYKDIVLNAIRYAMEQKSKRAFAWCIMTNHVHLVFDVSKPNKQELVLGGIKRYTSRKITEAIENNPQESRKEWMLEQFRTAAQKTSDPTKYQFWRHDNKQIELWSEAVIKQKVLYIHSNLVEQGLVFRATDYLYSSTADYTGIRGLLRGVEVIEQVK